MSQYFALKDHLEKLNHLVAVADCGSISAAARFLKLTQSAVSHSIAALEAALEVALLNRLPKGVELTDSGRILYEYSRRFMDDLEGLERRIQNPFDENAGKIRIGCHETLAIHVFPDIINAYVERYPKLNISITSGRVDPLIAGVLEERFHLAVTVEPFRHRDLISVPIYSGTIGFLAPTRPVAKYPFLSKDQLTLDEASAVPILTDVEAHVRQGFSLPNALLAAGLKLSNLYELNSFEAAMRLASTGAGIAVVATRNAQEMIDRRQLREIRIQGIARQSFGAYRICATYLRKNRQQTTIVELVDELKSMLP